MDDTQVVIAPDPGTDLRGRSLVCACGRTLRCDSGMGEAGLSRLLHDLLPQYHGALGQGLWWIVQSFHMKTGQLLVLR